MNDLADWRAWRKAGIGASDVAAILGISPFASPFSVWAEKVLDIDPDDSATEDELERMWMGQALEPTIATMFHRKTGLYVVGVQERVQHPEHPWMRATLDGRVVEVPISTQDWILTGEGAVPDELVPLGNLESKTTIDSPKAWEEAIPAYYAAQCQWQMDVTGAERTWIAAIHAAFGLKFRVYELERDDSDIAFIRERVTEFYERYVLTGEPPPTDAHSATTETLRGIPADAGAEIELDSGLILSLRLAKAAHKHTEEQVTAAENMLKAAMGEATEGLVDGTRVVTWRPQSTTRIDTTALKADLPDVAETYSKTTESRVLRLSKEKES